MRILNNSYSLIVVILLVIGVSVGFIVIQNSQGHDPIDRADDNQTLISPVDTEDELSVAVGVEVSPLKYGLVAVFFTEVTNNSESSLSYDFQTTCTGGSLFIDGKDTGLANICSDEQSQVIIEPKQKQRFDHKFTLLKEFLGDSIDGSDVGFSRELVLAPGNHTLLASWNGVYSEELIFKVAE